MAKAKGSYTGVPPVVKIGAFDYKITLHELVPGDEPAWGQIIYEDYEIQLQREQPSPGVAADTLIHEIIHGVWKGTTLGDFIGKNLEESVVKNLTSGLIGVLRDNPLLLKWLVKQLGK